MCDLLIRAGRVVCPVTSLDGPGAVAVRDGRIVAVGANLDVAADQVVSCPNALLLPGLIDLHAHPARSGSVFGVDPDRHMLARGSTTVLSQGDAGAANCSAYVAETIDKTTTRVRLAINISAIGESGEAGCFERIEHADVEACVAAIKRFRDVVWGIAVNVSHHSCGATDPRDVLRRGLQAAERTGLPLLYGMRRPEDWSIAEQLAHLRAGDVVTYCFRRRPHCIVEQGRVLPAIREARQRGVLFDVGHGAASFDFGVAETAIGDGFLPDTISTDLQLRHVGSVPTHDLPRVMSKLRAAGMPEDDVFRAVTARPASVLRLNDQIGTLQPGSCADLTALNWNTDGDPLQDVNGNSRAGGWWEPVLTVRAGRVVMAVA